ncbi:MAG: adenylyl-sulfate kinase [Crocinitomicaceae bacterium]|nr:adenylyl-sulfate kinase [Crocinitomicaceae bacterium]MDG1775979.1 adenylyl-sulfate kinase [Crocinitomicaceae bacterium]
MYKDTNIRSIVKAISWRAIALVTTMVIVYLFTGEIETAIKAGVVETGFKLFFYWMHERMWFKVRWGRKKIEPFNLWFTGLPLSGKTTIADLVYTELEKLHIPIERIDASNIRNLVPGIGFTRADRNIHMHRIGYLIQKLQKNSVSTVVSFVSPYTESRKAIREMVQQNIVVHVKAEIETCKARDYKGVYAKAIAGELKNFTGVNDVYEEPKHAEITIDTETMSAEEAANVIVKYIKKNYVK